MSVRDRWHRARLSRVERVQRLVRGFGGGFAVMAIWLSTSVVGCGAATKNIEPLDLSVSVYNDGLRWQRFQQAASRLPIDERDDFLDERDQLNDELRIHHYEIIRVRYGPENQRARVQVKYTWFLESRGVVHETHAVQRWRRDEAYWMMTGEQWLRGEPMPGVAQPDTPVGDEATEVHWDAADVPTESDSGS